MSTNNPRDIAYKILNRVFREGAYINLELKKELKKDFSQQDKALITEIVYGVVRWKNRIDYIIDKFSRLHVNKMKLGILNILRIGIYQILFLSKIPPFAACNESVELAKRYYDKRVASFVNAVLRNLLRSEDIEYPDRKNTSDFLSVFYSYPKWMVERLLTEYSESFVEEFLKFSNIPGDICIRTNRLRITADELADILVKKGLQVKKGEYFKEALYIKGTSIEEMDEYRKGYFMVQDEASMLVSYILEPKPGELILDVCSAPGGKTTHIAELMNNRGRIVARDVYPHKLDMVIRNAKRLGIDIIETEEKDALLLYRDDFERFDRVLVDAPCSGLGIIRNKPEVKWNRKPEDISKLAEMQYNILHNSSFYVKRGGTLVYSTCTITREENIGVVNRFLSEHKNFKLDEFSLKFGKNIDGERGLIEVFPNTHGLDGFFIAKMVKLT